MGIRSPHPGAVTILVIEDDPDHAELIVLGLTRGHPELNVIHVGDGVEASAFLRRETPHNDAARPDLILLDLNLPMIDGHEILASVKSDPELAPIPVIVLSTSNAETDISRAYNAGANSYLVKPLGFQRFTDLMAMVSSYWAGANRVDHPAA